MAESLTDVAPHNDPAKLLAIALFAQHEQPYAEARIRELRDKTWHRYMLGPQCDECWTDPQPRVLCPDCQFVRARIWPHLTNDAAMRAFNEYLGAKDS